MTVIYIEDGIRLIEPASHNQKQDLEAAMPTWMPGAQYNEPVATKLNPVLYPLAKML